ncbi:CHAT domain-containing protein [Microbacterium rhizosphaerae]|uniref:CHAT domain-containing protein n=1 Tax=Microbacterium rhizosphaerae TaxID=1678237 RepID=A0ABZ0SKS4_9MICO|nr:CHAT domain-containing protein [Microbacterium rhizosphaerae]WPR89997.1 CHAT domain-containing protein [Microbacterium rhizosphaerae]
MAVTMYDDLQLRIDRDADGSYRVLAMAPDGRTARGSFVSPLSDDELDDFVQRVGLARRRGGSADTRMDAIRDVGAALFDSLIKEEVGTVFYSARSAAAERDRGLRITLRLSGSPELMRLPWEFLYKRPRFLAQSIQTPVVRALDVDSAMRPQRLTLPLRILAMVSSPSGYPELDADAERRNLERALAAPRAAGLVEVSWLERATLGDLARRVEELDGVHVLHYIGHGAYDEVTDSGILVLETPQGRAHDVSGEEIGAILQDETSLRLVVLNACEGARTSHVDPFSGVAASLVNFDIPAVIGMQFEITDDAAIAFSESLYTGLAHGLPVDAALAPARRAIVGAMLPTEFGTPVLYLRDGDARLFDLQGGLPAAAQQEEPPDDTDGPASETETEAESAENPVVEESSPAEEGGPVDKILDAGASVDAPQAPEAMAAAESVAAEPVGAEPLGAEHPLEVAGESPARSIPEPGVQTNPPEPPPDRGARPLMLAVATAWAGALLLVVAAAFLFAAGLGAGDVAAAAGLGAQTLGVVALAVHSSVRPRDAVPAAYLYGAAAVLSAVVMMTVGTDARAASWVQLAYGLVLVLTGGWLIRASRRVGSRFAASLVTPAPAVIVSGAVSTIAIILWLSGVNSSEGRLWPLSVLGIAAGYVVSALALKREARGGSAAAGFRVEIPVALAWTGAVALAVLVASVLAQDPNGPALRLDAATAQLLAVALLASHHAARPHRDSRLAAAGYGLAAVVSLVSMIGASVGESAYAAYAVIPWAELVVGILLGAVGLWLTAVGRARGGRFGKSLWIPGPYVIAGGAMTALGGAVAVAGSYDLGAVIRWIWLAALLGMAVGYALAAVSLGREGVAGEASADREHADRIA